DGIRDDLVTGVQTCALPILVLWRSFDWKMPFSRSKPPETKNVVASLPPEALTSYCWRTPWRNGVFCTSGLKLSTATIVQIPWARSEERRVGKERRTTR